MEDQISNHRGEVRLPEEEAEEDLMAITNQNVRYVKDLDTQL